MLPLFALAAAAGLVKGLTVDKEREDRQRKLAAETQRYSPWTHMQANPIQEADPLGSAIGFGTTGAMLGQSIDNSKAQNDWLKRGGNPSYTAALNGSGGGMALGKYGPVDTLAYPSQSSPWSTNPYSSSSYQFKF